MFVYSGSVLSTHDALTGAVKRLHIRQHLNQHLTLLGGNAKHERTRNVGNKVKLKQDNKPPVCDGCF